MPIIGNFSTICIRDTVIPIMFAMPNNWPPPRDKWPQGFTAGKDSWLKWYRGRTRHAAAASTPLKDVQERWIDKKRAIDAGSSVIRQRRPGEAPTLREAVSMFLEHCEHRVKTGKPTPLSKRSLGNYTEILNDFGEFAGGDLSIARVNTPEVFTNYIRQYSKWKASGYDSIISRVGALFRWCVEMEYIDRWRPGPMFVRPAKSEIRHDRIQLEKSIKPVDIARLYLEANQTIRCWIGLGVSAGFTNSDIANLPIECVDLEAGIIDYRRRKTGKIRRVCPLPLEVVADMRKYKRPREHGGLFFVTENGKPYSRVQDENWKPTSSLLRLWNKLRVAAGVPKAVFTGLRTTFYNLAPGGEYEIERKIIMGRAQGTIDLDSYLESVKLERLRHVVECVWCHVRTALADECLKAEQTLESPLPSSGSESPAPLPTIAP